MRKSHNQYSFFCLKWYSTGWWLGDILYFYFYHHHYHPNLSSNCIDLFEPFYCFWLFHEERRKNYLWFGAITSWECARAGPKAPFIVWYHHFFFFQKLRNLVIYVIYIDCSIECVGTEKSECPIKGVKNLLLWRKKTLGQ